MPAQFAVAEKPIKPIRKRGRYFSALLLGTAIFAGAQMYAGQNNAMASAVRTAAAQGQASISQKCLHYAEAKRLYVMKGNRLYVNYSPKYERYDEKTMSQLMAQDKIADYKYLADATRALVDIEGKDSVEKCEGITKLAQELKDSEIKFEKADNLRKDTNQNLGKNTLQVLLVVLFIYIVSLSIRSD